ncbi:hypothetical protein GCM10009850_103040 [Nonomuraea monospora]|uniref:Major facilitator superfamily (MFS) profile domain-containing protein n=1 Tax=Nonomuraea monospora TaxID=568818 RepID=A0ABP5PVS9_9ACTN
MQALARSRSQAWSYAALLTLLMLGQATSAIPSPLYALYAEKWDYPPFLTIVIFAAYGAVAVVAILVSGALSDRYGRRPVLLAAVLLLIAGLAVFVLATGPGTSSWRGCSTAPRSAPPPSPRAASTLWCCPTSPPRSSPSSCSSCSW